MTSEGTAHGKSDDFVCAPPWPEAKRRVTRGLRFLTDASWITRVSLRDEERNIIAVQDN